MCIVQKTVRNTCSIIALNQHGQDMKLRVLGCHGGETSKHRTSAFLVDETLAIDAGALTSQLTLREQKKIRHVLISHAHMDHIRDLATLTDNRAQSGGQTLEVVATAETIGVLRKHFFNGALWPNFERIRLRSGEPSLRLVELAAEGMQVGAFEVKPVAVSHTVDCSAFFVRKANSPGKTLVYGGDTGATDKLWKAIDLDPKVSLVMADVSFPNAEQAVASRSGHHTPQSLMADLAKSSTLVRYNVLAYHLKPAFEAKTERELARLRGVNLEVARLGAEYKL